MAIAQVIERDFGGRRDLSGLGGVETGRDAAEFLLLGANSVQVNPCWRSGFVCTVDVPDVCLRMNCLCKLCTFTHPRADNLCGKSLHSCKIRACL